MLIILVGTFEAAQVPNLMTATVTTGCLAVSGQSETPLFSAVCGWIWIRLFFYVLIKNSGEFFWVMVRSNYGWFSGSAQLSIHRELEKVGVQGGLVHVPHPELLCVSNLTSEMRILGQVYQWFLGQKAEYPQRM